MWFLYNIYIYITCNICFWKMVLPNCELVLYYFLFTYTCVYYYIMKMREERKKVKQKGQYQGRTVWGESCTSWISGNFCIFSFSTILFIYFEYLFTTILLYSYVYLSLDISLFFITSPIIISIQLVLGIGCLGN